MQPTNAPAEVLRAQVAYAVAAARAEGREVLLEPEGLILAAALGLHVPRLVELRDPAELRRVDLDAFPGHAVVLKVVSPDILHKTDVGGVRVVAKERGAIARAIAAMRDQLQARSPRPALRGWLLCEFVPHGKGPGEQLLFGMRWTRDFGAVVTLGFGGIEVEHLARSIVPGRDVAILSPAMADPVHVDRALEGKTFVPLLCGGLRHQAPRLERTKLVALLQRALRLAAACMPAELLEFEINPLVPTPHGAIALDALARLGRGDAPTVPAPKPLHKLVRLLQPSSIAIVGVSEKMNVGHIILNNCLHAGFDAERLFVLKPGTERIEGCRCVPDVAALPAPVDLLVVSVDAAQVPGLVEEVVERRAAETLILIPGGLGDGDASDAEPAPAARVRAAVARARRSDWGGPLLNGPNCLGVRSLPGRFDTLFIPRHKLRFPDTAPDPIAFLSQSGAFAVARTSQLPWLNPRYVVTFGNQIDLTIGDYLQTLAADRAIEIFACYVEGFVPGDGLRWLDAAATIARSGRPVLLYRAGRTDAGAKAAASHTASVAGDYAVSRELARTAGVLVADSPADFDDLLRLCVRLRGKEVRGLRLGALSNAGFECVAIADHQADFTLPPLAASTQRTLHDLLARRRLDSIVGVHNPLDVTPILDDEPYANAAGTILEDPNVDVGIIGCVPLTAALNTLPRDEPEGPRANGGHAEDIQDENALPRRLARLHAETTKAWIVVVDSGPSYDAMARQLESDGIPVFRGAERALRLFSEYCSWRQRHQPAAGLAAAAPSVQGTRIL